MHLDSKFLKSKKGLQLLSNLFHSSGEGIMVFNRYGAVEALNPRAQQMFGYTEEELVGQTMEVLIPSELRSKHAGHRGTYMKKPAIRSMGIGKDLSGLKKNGTTFPIEISLTYLTHEEETLVVAFITDITVRKRQEKTLQEQSEKLAGYTALLETKVKDRTRELEHLNMGLQSQIQERKLAEQALKKSLEVVKKTERKIQKSLEKERELSELKSRFVSMASHEFRTPLTTISSSADLIKKYPETAQQPNREKHVERISNSVKNLIGILNDFLSLEKLESRAVNVKHIEVSLHTVLKEVIQEMTVTLKKGQSIRCVKSKDVQFRTDPHLLKNLMYNLVSNASKYSAEEAEIVIHCEMRKGKIEIEVVDFGIGIPKKEQKHLFDRFFRAGNVTNIQGTGLGLHIAKKYIDLLGGTISFVSTEGNGSTFKLSIPRK